MLHLPQFLNKHKTLRNRLTSRRTAVINQLRAFCSNEGWYLRRHQRSSRPPWLILENAEAHLTPQMRGKEGKRGTGKAVGTRRKRPKYID